MLLFHPHIHKHLNLNEQHSGMLTGQNKQKLAQQLEEAHARRVDVLHLALPLNAAVRVRHCARARQVLLHTSAYASSDWRGAEPCGEGADLLRAWALGE